MEGRRSALVTGSTSGIGLASEKLDDAIDAMYDKDGAHASMNRWAPATN